ncbi:hypothetical protein U1Q18_024458 [Sarracenia purpurea var. burkii]
MTRTQGGSAQGKGGDVGVVAGSGSRWQAARRGREVTPELRTAEERQIASRSGERRRRREEEERRAASESRWIEIQIVGTGGWLD